MTRLSLLFLLALVPVLAHAEIPREPEYTFRWNSFHSVSAIDSFAIAATNNGLALLKRSPGSPQFMPVEHLFLPTPPREQKRYGSILVVRNIADQLSFFDLSVLPELPLLGTVDIDIPFEDFVIDDSMLYTSRGFEGIWRYHLQNYSTATYLDSNITGIRYSDLAISGDTLFALDDYNGILFFKLQDTGFASYLDHLYIPFQASSFTAIDSGLVIATYDNTLLLAQTDSGEAAIADTIELLVTPDHLLADGNRVIVTMFESDVLEGIDFATNQHLVLQSDEVPVDGLLGDISISDADREVLFADISGGIQTFSIDSFFAGTLATKSVVPRTSAVTGLAMLNGKLFVGGQTDPLDVYMVSLDGQPSYKETPYSGLNQITDVSAVHDSLFVTYPQIRRALIHQVTPDTLVYRGGLFYDPDRYHRIVFNPFKVDTLRSWFAVGERDLRAYTITDSGYIEAAGSINTLSGIYDIGVVDSMIVVSTFKGVYVYRMYQDFSFAYRGNLNASYTVREIRAHHGRLLLFDGPVLRVLDLRDAANPVLLGTLAMPSTVSASDLEGDFLYTVGESGIAVYDVSNEMPRLVEYGGISGSLIAAEHGLVAVSDGRGVHLYDLRNIVTDVEEEESELPGNFTLQQNYPNPFNPLTTIDFMLPKRDRVTLTVFNLLGQEVCRLVDAELPAGRHKASWNGTNSDGHPAATGLYLYRLTTSEAMETRKMMLLK